MSLPLLTKNGVTDHLREVFVGLKVQGAVICRAWNSAPELPSLIAALSTVQFFHEWPGLAFHILPSPFDRAACAVPA